MNQYMDKWFNRPEYFRRGFWTLLIISTGLNIIFNELEGYLYIFYIFCVIFLGLGYYKKPPLFLLSFTVAVVTCRYYLIHEANASLTMFIIHIFTYYLITIMAAWFMIYVHKVNEKHLELTIALANALDSRDSYTRHHSEKVAKYSVEIAKKMNLPEDQLNIIQVGGLLHDIGKIGIPEHILLKPETLTKEEYQLIKKHPAIGFEMIKHVENYKDRGVLDIVLYHHERYDGKGYPCSLKENQIPLVARIVAVADAYDAIISRRVYKNELSSEYALNEIKKNKGTQFDPEVVDAFLTLFPEEESMELKSVCQKSS